MSRKNILGGIWMKNHDIIFDRENNKIGFAEANCSYGYDNGIHNEEYVNSYDWENG